MSGVDEVVRELRDVLGLTEGPVNTGTVLITPSSGAHAKALHVAQHCKLDAVLRDLGAVVAREFANELQAANLRPADYAEFADLGPIIRARVMELLRSDPKVFLASLGEQLRMRG